MADVNIPDTIDQRINISHPKLVEFCKRWKIIELAAFGSALRDDFNSDSDIDLLASFLPTADWSLLDHIQMEEELRHLTNRKIDLVSRRAIEKSDNAIRRKAILESAQVLYVA